jgi:hypothetical protein
VIEVVFSDRDQANVVKEFVAKYKPGFPVGIVDGEYFVKWSGVTPEMRPTVPMMFIIDRNGMVQAQYMGSDPMLEEKYQAENLRAKIMQYLPQPVPGAKSAPAAKPPAKK